MAVLQEAKHQSVRLSAGKQQLRNAEKGCSSIAHNIVMKAVGPGAAALSGTDWTDAVSDAYSKSTRAQYDSPAGIATKEKMSTSVHVYPT